MIDSVVCCHDLSYYPYGFVSELSVSSVKVWRFEWEGGETTFAVTILQTRL
jgi:hypothetical protein